MRGSGYANTAFDALSLRSLFGAGKALWLYQQQNYYVHGVNRKIIPYLAMLTFFPEQHACL